MYGQKHEPNSDIKSISWNVVSKSPHQGDASIGKEKLSLVVKTNVEGEALHLRWFDGQSGVPVFGKIVSDEEEGRRIFSVS